MLIGRSIGTAYRKEILKNIGKVEDEEFGDGEASGQSSKQMILGSETSSLPFGKHLDDSSSMHQSPISMRMSTQDIERFKKARLLTRNKSNLPV